MTTDNETVLRECPFCGDKDDFNPSVSKLSKYAEPGDAEAGTTANLDAGLVDAGFYIECDKCAGCGPPHDTKAEAITAWNSRPASASEGVVEAQIDSAYYEGACQALRTAEQSMDAARQWVQDGCGGRAGVYPAALSSVSVDEGERLAGELERLVHYRNTGNSARWNKNIAAWVGKNEARLISALRKGGGR